jgi:hypothetical protein
MCVRESKVLITSALSLAVLFSRSLLATRVFFPFVLAEHLLGFFFLFICRAVMFCLFGSLFEAG